MKINFKKGLRRIYIVFLAIITIPFFIFYCTNGFILDDTKFIDNTYVQSEQTFKKMPLYEFAKTYLQKNESNESYNRLWTYSDIKCFPYKQQCKLNGIEYTFLNNKSISLNEVDSNFKENNTVKIIMPSSFKYLYWQIFDFLKIFMGFMIAYSLYMFAEILICWIIKGFKNE